MSVSDKTLAQIGAAYIACYRLVEALRDYNQGTDRPAVQLGRYTVDEVDAMITAVKATIEVLDPTPDPAPPEGGGGT